MYTIKFWNTKKKYDAGEADVLGEDFTAEECDMLVKLLRYVYAFEMYNTRTGETYYHSME